jgi:hypothetical protein
MVRIEGFAKMSLPPESGSDRLESFEVDRVSFLQEQDGVPERLLKERLARAFQSLPAVLEAYLVRVRYGESPEVKVALALHARESAYGALPDLIVSEFRKTFRTDQSLDILFLTRQQQKDISVIAKPFYRRTSS